LEKAAEITALPNGVTVLTDPMKQVRSVSLGVWIRSGSRQETREIKGLSHFIEHSVFKGTQRRTALDIACEADDIGGMLDAFTHREHVCFHTRVLDEHVGQAFDLLADLVLHPQFDAQEVEREKEVVLQEIKMAHDVPEDLVYEVFWEKLWHDHPLGWPILGTPETVTAFHSGMLHQWFRSWYIPGNMVVSGAGNVSHRQMVDLASSYFEALRPGKKAAQARAPVASPHITLRARNDLAQVHICIGVPALRVTDSRRFALAALNNILGMGMSSRLFQNIRERQGLAYAIMSDMNPYSDAGMLHVYAGTSLDKAAQLIRSVVEEFRRMKDEPVSAGELRLVKNQMRGLFLMARESTSHRMADLARHFLYFRRVFDLEEILQALDAVTPENIQQLAGELFVPERIAVTLLGNLEGFTLSRNLLAC
jgi:predicted Zn-dependent peptidase